MTDINNKELMAITVFLLAIITHEYIIIRNIHPTVSVDVRPYPTRIPCFSEVLKELVVVVVVNLISRSITIIGDITGNYGGRRRRRW